MRGFNRTSKHREIMLFRKNSHSHCVKVKGEAYLLQYLSSIADEADEAENCRATYDVILNHLPQH